MNARAHAAIVSFIVGFALVGCGERQPVVDGGLDRHLPPRDLRPSSDGGPTDSSPTSEARPVSDGKPAEGATPQADAAIGPGKPGAILPITYNLAQLGGPLRYVAPGGSDTTGTGSATAPFATLKKAVSAAGAGDTIVIRGGTYPIGANAVVINKAGLTLIAYPGEVPTFDGSLAAPTSTTPDGNLRRFAYQPIPAGLGEGLNLSNLPKAAFSGTQSGSAPTGLAASRGFRCVNPATPTTYSSPSSLTYGGCPAGTTPFVITGYYPDQVWVDGIPLVQVLDKSLVTKGTFYLARAAAGDANPSVTDLYLSAADAADMARVRVSSSTGTFLQVAANHVRIEGIRVQRHSPDWSDYALVVASGVQGTKLRNLELVANANIALKLAGGGTPGGSKLVRDTSLDRVSATGSGHLGAVFLYTDDTTVTSSWFAHTDPHAEFAGAPQRGAIKATKNHRLKVVGSLFEANGGPDLWCDQSNHGVLVARSRFVSDTDSCIFFEISHDLTVVDSHVRTTSPSVPTLRLAGSSGIKLVNNTLVGGKDVVGVYTDGRSKTYNEAGSPRYCSEHRRRYDSNVPASACEADCNVSYTSDFDLARPGAYAVPPAVNLTPGLNWMPAVDLLVNNIIAHPTAAGNCGTHAALCARVFVNYGTIHHQVAANTVFRSVPRPENPVVTVIDGNVYASTGALFRVNAEAGQPGGFSASDISSLAGSAGLGSSYYGFTGAGGTARVEQHGLAGPGLVNPDGSPTSALQAQHANAAPVPAHAAVNAYVPAGTRHYGALSP